MNQNNQPNVELPTPPTEEEYELQRVRLAFRYAPTIYACAHCHWPVANGYCCAHCGSSNPQSGD